LILRGRIVQPDGAPAAGAIVFAYHTDAQGLYDRRGAGEHSWRLKGWTKADGEGRFMFETIRPGPYPGRHVPAHVHFTVFTPDGARYHAGEVKFENDPLVSEPERDASKRAGEFGEVRPVRQEGNAEQVEFALPIDPAQRF
jgi:protocatechuate 3,4-dioxygenase beta subunit